MSLTISDKNGLEEICQSLQIARWKSHRISVSVDLDNIQCDNPENLAEVARCCKLKQVIVKKTFMKAEDLSIFLSALSENPDAKDIHLDISGNDFDSECAEQIRKLLDNGVIKFLFLPGRLALNDVETIFTALQDMKFTLETLDISDSLLTEHCLEMLHQIMLKRKIKNTLFLHSCVFMAQDVKSVRKLLKEIERSKIIVEPQRLSLSWDDGPRFQKLDTTEERKSRLQTQSKSANARPEKLDRVALSSQTESRDSGLGITLETEDMNLLGPPKKFPSTLSLQPKTNARKRLIAREGFESTQSLDIGVGQQRKCQSPRPSPIFEGDIMEDFGSVFLHDRHSFESEDSFEQMTKVWGNLKIVDDDFIRNQNWRKLHTCVMDESSPKRPLIISCRIQQNAKIVQADCTFRYSEHEPDKNVYIDNKRVTANTVAMDRAQVTLPSVFSNPATIVVAYLGVFIPLALYHLFFGF